MRDRVCGVSLNRGRYRGDVISRDCDDWTDNEPRPISQRLPSASSVSSTPAAAVEMAPMKCFDHGDRN